MTFSAIKIGSFAKVKGGKRLPKGAQLYDEPTEHPYIRVTDMYSDGLNSFQIKYIDQQTHDSISRYTISIHDVYISIAGTIGRVGMVPDTFNGANLTENAAKITDIDSSFNPRFLMYFLRSHLGQGQIAAKTGGTSQPKLALYRIEEIYCPKLPRDMQDEIVLAAKNYDDLIENNRRRIQLLDESARLLYQEWFVHLRFPGHEQVKIIDGVPEGWAKEPLENLLVLQRGFDLPISNRIEGNVPIYASTGINGFHNVAKVKGPGVVTGRSGSLGTVMYVAKDYWPLNTTLWVKEFKKASPIFATFLLRAMKLEGYNGGAAVPTLNRNDVHKVDVLCPDAKLMSEFEVQIENIFKQIDKLKEYNEKLAQARDLLLPKLMSGELTV
jgi:Restriction endonuclease S subunits